MQRLKEALPSIAATSAYIFVAARVGLFGKDEVHITTDEKLVSFRNRNMLLFNRVDLQLGTQSQNFYAIRPVHVEINGKDV